MSFERRLRHFSGCSTAPTRVSQKPSFWESRQATSVLASVAPCAAPFNHLLRKRHATCASKTLEENIRACNMLLLYYDAALEVSTEPIPFIAFCNVTRYFLLFIIASNSIYAGSFFAPCLMMRLVLHFAYSFTLWYDILEYSILYDSFSIADSIQCEYFAWCVYETNNCQ